MTYLQVIIPTRGRPWAVAKLAEAFEATCGADTRVTFAVDYDDPLFSAYRDAIGMFGDRYTMFVAQPDPVQHGVGMIGALNQAAMAHCARLHPALAVMFMGDDHRVEGSWDAAIVAEMARLGAGIVYGDDGIQGPNLPTAVAISTGIICELGYFAPPTLKHLYADNSWLALGRGADCITYLHDVKIRHLHPAGGLAPWDEGYARVNSAEMYEHDRVEFERWLQEDAPKAIGRIRKLLPQR